ncbi:MAG TPA: hypothetical protein PK020_14475 [Ilumatobacteraceae bacterium]|nr:hypothetical protein [Ilumatobacteraceae bacterium]HRB03088.1 hypothetical protein [Ilumatobacteraceae bacterium]
MLDTDVTGGKLVVAATVVVVSGVVAGAASVVSDPTVTAVSADEIDFESLQATASTPKAVHATTVTAVRMVIERVGQVRCDMGGSS